MAIGAVVARILTQYSDKGSKAARKDIAKLGDQFDAFAKKTVKAFGIAAAAVGAFAIKVGKDAVQAAIADQKSQVLLANSLRNTVGATDLAIASVEDYISKLQSTVKVTDDELRPSLAKLAAVTGSVTAAQELLGLALDVSAFSGSDLGSATNAVTKALQGNFRTLQRLVPGLSTATIKSKDFVAIINEVTRITQGSAAARAGTLEYRLQGLRIAYGEILETLGYALLPVIEKFAKVIERDVLPQIERWVNANKKGLAQGFKQAAKAALELLKGAIKFGEWVVANFKTIKNIAVLIAGMWAVSKVIAFASAIGKVTLAYKNMRTAAAGAAVASATANGAAAGLSSKAALSAGTKAGAIGTGIALFTLGIGQLDFPGSRKRANRLSAELEAKLAGYQGAPGPSDLAGLTGGKKSKVKVDKSMQTYLDFLNKINKVENKAAKSKKELTKRQEDYNKLLADMGIKTTEQQDAITQFAIRANLLKQAAITGSPLTSIGSPTPMNMATAGMNNPITVNVQGSVISEKDLVSMIANELKKRTLAGNPVTGTYLGSNTDNLAFKVRYL